MVLDNEEDILTAFETDRSIWQLLYQWIGINIAKQ